MQEPVVLGKRLGRNDPCWCGSGKKYKKCHLTEDEKGGRDNGMSRPDDMADVLLQIIQDGIVSARWAGWRKNPEWAAIEASHVHNLPEVIRKYGPEKLVYYWDSET